ncbi:UDP-3-O-acyl-N-acetylglucosamine deacetylase [Candidatus Woesearchaeota archaeon]|nr:UDP-3-O-acyl-N-acetylglucosamine deacetylase [Candidatus Woesearchaeota archaeon]
MVNQKSIKESVRVDGINIYNNRKNHVTFKPAQEDSGLVFIVNGKAVPASLKHAQHRKRGISLDNGKVAVYLVEHLLSPVYALGIDNLVIELSDNACPTTDNCAEEFFQALKGARSEQPAEKKFLVYNKKTGVVVKRGEEQKPDSLTVGTSRGFIIDYFASYPHKVIGEQKYRFEFDEETYERDIMQARSPALFPDWVFEKLSERHFLKSFWV